MKRKRREKRKKKNKKVNYLKTKKMANKMFTLKVPLLIAWVLYFTGAFFYHLKACGGSVFWDCLYFANENILTILLCYTLSLFIYNSLSVLLVMSIAIYKAIQLALIVASACCFSVYSEYMQTLDNPVINIILSAFLSISIFIAHNLWNKK